MQEYPKLTSAVTLQDSGKICMGNFTLISICLLSTRHVIVVLVAVEKS